MAQPGPVTTASVRPALPSHTVSSTIGACHGCMKDVLLFHLWWRPPVFPSNTESQGSGVPCWRQEWWLDGVLPNTSGFSGLFWLPDGVRVLPSSWILVPGLCSSRSLYLVAIDMKTVAMNWNSWWVHTIGHKAHPRKQGYKWACGNHVLSMVSQKSVYPPQTDSSTDVGTLPT